MTQTRNKIFDDVSQLFSNALGVAQGARSEAETAMKSWIERWIAERNLVTREEFEAVREMAVKARDENEALLARIGVLERAVGGTDRPAPAGAPMQGLDAQDVIDAPGEGAAIHVDPDAAGQPAAQDLDHFERPDGSLQS